MFLKNQNYNIGGMCLESCATFQILESYQDPLPSFSVQHWFLYGICFFFFNNSIVKLPVFQTYVISIYQDQMLKLNLLVSVSLSLKDVEYFCDFLKNLKYPVMFPLAHNLGTMCIRKNSWKGLKGIFGNRPNFAGLLSFKALHPSAASC